MRIFLHEISRTSFNKLYQWTLRDKSFQIQITISTNVDIVYICVCINIVRTHVCHSYLQCAAGFGCYHCLLFTALITDNKALNICFTFWHAYVPCQGWITRHAILTCRHKISKLISARETIEKSLLQFYTQVETNSVSISLLYKHLV